MRPALAGIRRPGARWRGFTLIEMLIAIALIAALAAALASFIFNLLERREVIRRHAESDLASSILIDRIEGDMFAALAGDGAGGAGIVGGPDRLRISTRAVALPSAGAIDAALGDLQGAEYRWVREARRLEARRWIGREAGATRFEPLSDNVERLRFRYLVGRTWRDRFDSAEAGGLPAAIEVAVWYGPASREAQEQAEAEREEDDDLLRFDSGLFGDEFDDEPFEDGGFAGDEDAPARAPDRRRIIVVPDGPEVAWRGAQP